MSRESTDEHPGVIVIGASAGGVDALSAVVGGLPAGLRAPVLVVLHITPRGRSVLPQILSSRSRLPAHHAIDGEPLVGGQVYVAPPDRHLEISDGHVRLGNGPRENGVRPALDTLFRSAANVFGARVIGVVLSGTLDDGTAGLIAIKEHGGIAVVQDPASAMFPSMPASAVRFAHPDHVATLEKIPALLTSLVDDLAQSTVATRRIASDEQPSAPVAAPSPGSAAAQTGQPSVFTCPECGGTLWEEHEGDLLRFRCRVGHVYSGESLLTHQRDSLEDALWTAVTALEERADVADRLADRMNDRHLAAAVTRYRRQATDSRTRAALIRHAIAELNEAGEDA